jgi:heterodisulfide reductase subunit C
VRSDFVQEIEKLSDQNVMSCYQCGKCSAGCPTASAMDLLPNQIIRLVQLGQEEDLIRSKTIWLCASCFTCEARCPKGIDVSKLLEAVRVVLLRKCIELMDPSKLPVEVIAEAPQQLLISSSRKLSS